MPYADSSVPRYRSKRWSPPDLGTTSLMDYARDLQKYICDLDKKCEGITGYHLMFLNLQITITD